MAERESTRKRKRTYTDEQKREALAVYEQHGPAEAHRQTGVNRTTISEWARQAGLTVKRANRTREAVAAARLSRAERTERLAEGLLNDTLRLREQLWQPAMVHDFTKDGTFVTGTLAEPTFSDKQRILTSLGIAVDKFQLLTGGATSRVERSEAEVRDRIKQLQERAAEEVRKRDELAARREQREATG